MTSVLSKEGFERNILVTVSVEKNLKDSSMRGIVLDHPELGLSQEFLVKGAEVNRLENLFVGHPLVKMGIRSQVLYSTVSVFLM